MKEVNICKQGVIIAQKGPILENLTTVLLLKLLASVKIDFSLYLPHRARHGPHRVLYHSSSYCNIVCCTDSVTYLSTYVHTLQKTFSLQICP